MAARHEPNAGLPAGVLNPAGASRGQAAAGEPDARRVPGVIRRRDHDHLDQCVGRRAHLLAIPDVERATER